MPSSNLVTVTYSVRPDKMNEFNSIIPGIVETINGQQSGVRLSVYRSDDDPNLITEVYECDSSDGYDNLEDALDEQTREAINRIAADFATSRQSVSTLNRVI